jgi:hypothetical protein
MGTTTRHETITGLSLQEAFRRLQKEDEREFGIDCYNGRWNNCQGVREVSAEEFDRRVKNYDITKHEPAIAKCVRKPITNTNKIKTDVVKYPNHGTRKWRTVYVAVPYYDLDVYVNIKEEKQADAIAKARAFTEKTGTTLRIIIQKELVSEKRNPELVAEIKYKKSSKERAGEWEIFGGMSD